MSNIPNVPPQNPGQSPIFLPRIPNPYLGIWWATQTVTNVPESVMGWLVAQGFEITGVSQDTTTVPPTNYFALTREGMQPWQVLLSLCNSYTKAANEAREANQIRYNQVVQNWTEMISTSQTQFNAQTNQQNVQAGVYLADLDRYMNAVEALINENRNKIVIDAQNANLALEQMNNRLSDLETNAVNNAATINSILTQQNNFLNTFLSNWLGKLNEIDKNFNDQLSLVLSNVASLGTVTETHITAYSAQFATLQNNYSSHAASLETLLATALANTNSFTSDVDAILAKLQTDYIVIDEQLEIVLEDSKSLADSHVSDYNSVLALLESDYLAHVPIATGFLTGLGTTELARINQEFAANLAAQIQDLISKGLYKSLIATDITARNHRDRDEQVQTLNDRLNREKFENQHRLYEQKVAMRLRTMDGKEKIYGVQQEVLRYHAAQVTGTFNLLQDIRNRTLQGLQTILSAKDSNSRLSIDVRTGLYSQLQEVRLRVIDSVDRVFQIRDAFAKWKNGESIQLFEQLQRIQTQHLSSIDRRHSLQQEVSRIAMSQRDALFAQLQSAVQAILAGKDRYGSLLMQHASTLAEHKHRAIAEQMNSSIQRLQGWSAIQEQNRSLMAYQLDERNKLLIGLYSFVEKREDIAPEWENMAKIVAALGDTGGGWVTP
jgi:hypothetical protein